MFCGDVINSSTRLSVSDPFRQECLIDSLNSLLNVTVILIIILGVIWYNCMKSGKKSCEIVRYHEHSSRWVLVLCLIGINLLELGEGVMVNQLNEGTSLKLHSIISSFLTLTGSVAAISFYHYVEKWNEPKMLFALFLYWPLATCVKIAKLLCIYGLGLTINHVRVQVTWAAIVTYSLLTGVDVTILILQKYLCSKSYKEELQWKYDILNIQYLHPFSTLFSRATFSWLIPLLKTGYQRPLELGDLGVLPEAAAESKGRKVSLWKCYWNTCWRTLAVGGIIKIMGDIVGLIGPLSISIILAYVTAVKKGTLPHGTAEEPFYPTTWDFLQNGFVMAFVVLFSTFLQSTFSNNFNHLAIVEGIHLRTALQCVVFKKALCMSTASGLDTGALVNHMSVDAFNMMMLFSMGHYIWAVPFKIVLLLILLYMQLGYSALIGAGTIYVLAPLQYFICSLISKIQKKALCVSDERLKRTTELLQGIKLLKLYGWESMFANLIQGIREKEIKILRSDAVYVALNTFITQASSIIVTLVTFALYSHLEGKPLSPSEVFTGLALFNQLTVPLYIIPFVIPMVINAVFYNPVHLGISDLPPPRNPSPLLKFVSTRRLVNFLSLPEVDSSLPWREDADSPDARVEFHPESGSVLLHVKEVSLGSRGLLFDPEEPDGVFLPDLYNHSVHEDQSVIVIKDGYFAYEAEYNIPSLRDINLQIPSGKLTIVVGTIGSGKSTLLSAILGELRLLSGSVHWNSTPLIAYVPQKPWLMNATLKENIMFGQPYDGRRYHQVVQACALQPDIDLLPARDLTEIGERGLNLSGGQKQRIALARAFYSPARLIILDDPLSALDAHVSAYIFEHGIKTLLLRRNRTVILVTHKLELISSAAKVVVMESGAVKQEGSVKEIENALQELNFSLKMPKRRHGRNVTHVEEDGTTRERHKLVRLLSRQTLYRTASSQDVRPRARLVSLSRQMSHDPSSPLPCHDWGDHDDPLPPISDPDDPDTGHKLLKSMKSIESLRSRSSASSASVTRRSWKCPPSRLNSRISTRTEDLIEEEEEDDDEDDANVDNKTGNSINHVPFHSGHLIREEERERGQISKAVYLTYLRACALPLALFVIFLIFATQGMKIGTDFWLSEWSAASDEMGEITTSHNASVIEHHKASVKDEGIHYYITIYAILSAISIVLAFFTNLASQLTSLRAVWVLHNRMLQNIVRCPMRFFDTTPVGRVVNRFSSDMNTIDKKLPVTLPILLRFILLCVSAILVDIIVTPYFLVVVIPLAAIYYFLQHFFRFTSRELQRLDCITKSPIFSHFSETVGGLTTIRAFRAENRFTETIMACININNAAFILVNCANCWLGVALDYLGGIILFIATMSALLTAIYGEVSPAFVGMSMTYTLLIPIYLNWVVRNLASAEMYMSAVERVYNYSKLEKEASTSKKSVELPKNWPNEGEVLFENVTLKYDTSSDPVLKNINLTIKPGEKVGICGRTGSGKSSLVMALFRMVSISGGKILIDGVDITSVPLETLRSKLSIIPQESIIFSGSIRENLDPGKQHTDEELWSALEAAQLKTTVLTLPSGLDYQVLDEGSNFSAGQCQLFCLARAIIRKSKILVMDEATSSLDPETDQVLQNAVASNYKQCTVISIAHRVQSILDFDKIVTLDSGRIAEVGNPHQLMNTKGSIFASLVKASQQQH